MKAERHVVLQDSRLVAPTSQRFGPADVDAVRQVADDYGSAVIGRYPERLTVQPAGTVRVMSRAFGWSWPASPDRPVSSWPRG